MTPKLQLSAASLGAVFVLASMLFFAGCDEDPARSVKIIARPNDPVLAEAIAKAAVAPPNWHPAGCPAPAAYKSGPSRVKISGPCALDFRSEVICHGAGDDFYASLKTKGKDQSTFAININVEKYTGPGNYDDAEMSVWVREGQKIYRWDRWSGVKISAVVGPDQKFVEIKRASLQGEPLLSACSRLPGHSMNFKYECDGIGDSPTAIESTTEIVEGTFKCVDDQAAASEK